MSMVIEVTGIPAGTPPAPSRFVILPSIRFGRPVAASTSEVKSRCIGLVDFSVDTSHARHVLGDAVGHALELRGSLRVGLRFGVGLVNHQDSADRHALLGQTSHVFGEVHASHPSSSASSGTHHRAVLREAHLLHWRGGQGLIHAHHRHLAVRCGRLDIGIAIVIDGDHLLGRVHRDRHGHRAFHLHGDVVGVDVAHLGRRAPPGRLGVG